MHNRQYGTFFLLIICVAVVAFWEVMSCWSGRPFRRFSLTTGDFAGFKPESGEWSVKAMHVEADHPSAPNILSFLLESEGSVPVLVRLVHGYNMPDCMRLKGYTVAFIDDARDAVDTVGRRQVWRLTSDIGESAIWVTAMIRASDFAGTDIDIRSLPFPRVIAGDDRTWEPAGLTWSSLRHPVRNFRRFLLRKWSNSRCNLACFLKLKQAPWASEDVLTLVAASRGSSAEPGVSRRSNMTDGAKPERVEDAGSGSGGEQTVAGQVLSAHAFIHSRLRLWRYAHTPDGEKGK